MARASFGELLEDFRDFLRQRNLPIWEKDDPRVLKIRAFRESTANLTNLANLSNWTNLDFSKAEVRANLMVCLIFKENFLLDQLIRAQQEKFLREGGFRENLFKRRLEYRRKA